MNNEMSKKKLESLLFSHGEQQCDELMPDIYEYTQGSLGAAIKEKVELHLKACKKCREAVVLFKQSIKESQLDAKSLIMKLRPAVNKLIDKIKKVASPEILPGFLYLEAAEYARGTAEKGKVSLSITPAWDGYLVVFVLDQDGEIGLAFPVASHVSNKFGKDEERIIEFFFPESGKRVLRAVFTRENIFQYKNLKWEDKDLVSSFIEEYLGKVSSHKAKLAINDLSVAG